MMQRFNTQPRGGGCNVTSKDCAKSPCFNTQPRGGGCYPQTEIESFYRQVSTHSRAEAAANACAVGLSFHSGFNTQPRGGGCSLHKKVRKISVLNTVFR